MAVVIAALAATVGVFFGYQKPPQYPTEWKTYINTQYDFQISYPPSWEDSSQWKRFENTPMQKAIVTINPQMDETKNIPCPRDNEPTGCYPRVSIYRMPHEGTNLQEKYADAKLFQFGAVKATGTFVPYGGEAYEFIVQGKAFDYGFVVTGQLDPSGEDLAELSAIISTFKFAS